MKRLASLRADERGAILVLVVAATLFLFVPTAALVVDIGMARQVARNYQNAADGGALAGAQGLPGSASLSPTPWYRAAYYAFGTLGLSPPADDCSGAPAKELPSGPGALHCYLMKNPDVRVYVETPWADPAADGSILPPTHQVHVKVCGTVLTGFGGATGIDFIKPCRLATGMSAFERRMCAVCVLNGPFEMSGSGTATVTGSGTWVNSSATNPGGGTYSSVDGLYVTGNATGFGPPSTPATVGVPAITDPLGWLQTPWAPDWVPPLLPCTGLPCGGKFTFDDSPGAANNQFVTPGIYTSINVIGGNSSQTLTLMPGFYVIRDKFEITSDVSVFANGVTIYFACKGGYEPPDFQLCGAGDEGAYFRHTGAGSVMFSATSSPDNPYHNLLFFFDRNNKAVQRFEGGSATFKGTMYAPGSEFVLGNGNFNTLFVVDKLTLSTSGLLKIMYNPSEQVPKYLPALIT